MPWESRWRLCAKSYSPTFGQFYNETAITAQDITDVIAFAIARPRRMTLNEILIRPTAQAL